MGDISEGKFAGIFKLRGAGNAILIFMADRFRMIDAGENVHEVLEALSFESVRIRDALLRSAGPGDLMTTPYWAPTHGTKISPFPAHRNSVMASRFQFTKESPERYGYHNWRRVCADSGAVG